MLPLFLFAFVFIPWAAEWSLDTADSFGDGTPDSLRLGDQADQQAFRNWFAFLAELQYFTPEAQRPAEIVDCSAFVRYAYREALRRHDGSWAASSRLLLIPPMESVGKYSYPHTAVGPALFRLRPGPFRPSDLDTGAFGQFADAESLQRYNTFFLTRDVAHAQRGDLLFFRRPVQALRYHTMIFIGNSQISGGDSVYVVYHTGPDGTRSGEIKRLSMLELLHYPDPQWQPRATNPLFLGVFRWNILRTSP